VSSQGKRRAERVSSPPTGTVTFFFTDIQGSTRLWERDAKRMQRALARHDKILKGMVESHGGYVFKMVGDACCAAFSSTPKALEAALLAQRAIFKEPWDEECKIRVRMALHTGEAEERDGDYFGPPVNRVARLLSSGHGGQTLLSHATREQVGDGLSAGADLKDMGEHRLKDLNEPEHIFQLLAPDLPSEFPPLKTMDAPSEDDRYRLIRQIGSGGMAEVYLAYDEILEREVAFKVLDRKQAENREAVERFRREARNAASLSHTNIVSIHDRGHTQDGTYYLVMEYMEGGTLEDLIQQEGPLSPQRATETALQVARALQEAHQKGVIHRDIKPQNILLSNSGEAKVADFGIARAATATTMTQVGSVMGTVHYMSPEQALGESATPRSDLYSLGVVLYEMLTGEIPYDAETPAGVVMKHVGGLSRSLKEANPEVPEELDAVTARLLSRDPDDRYPDANALVEELERAKEGLPLTEETMRARTRARRAKRLRRRSTLAVLALVLVSVGVITAVALNRWGGLFAEAQTIPEANVPGDLSQPLAPGRYATQEFDPALSFTIDQNPQWRVSYPEADDVFEITTEKPPLPEEYSGLTFVRPQRIYSPDGQDQITLGSDTRMTDAPEDMVSWLRNHPDLDTSNPVPVTVGGKAGVRLDVMVSPVPKDDYSLDCFTGGPCIYVLGYDDDNGLALWADQKNRLIVLEAVDGETVIIAVGGPAQEFAEFWPKAQGLLDTLEWGAVS
jgi:serine/threonine protein kinase/class 3 adenylate cyclase